MTNVLYISDASEKFVGVYWDIENCQLPSKINPDGFVQKIRSRFLKGKTLVEFLCVCDNTNVSKSVIDGLSKEEVHYCYIFPFSNFLKLV